jgi:hypothetical protein
VAVVRHLEGLFSSAALSYQNASLISTLTCISMQEIAGVNNDDDDDNNNNKTKTSTAI